MLRSWDPVTRAVPPRRAKSSLPAWPRLPVLVSLGRPLAGQLELHKVPEPPWEQPPPEHQLPCLLLGWPSPEHRSLLARGSRARELQSRTPLPPPPRPQVMAPLSPMAPPPGSTKQKPKRIRVNLPRNGLPWAVSREIRSQAIACPQLPPQRHLWPPASPQQTLRTRGGTARQSRPR